MTASADKVLANASTLRTVGSARRTRRLRPCGLSSLANCGDCPRIADRRDPALAGRATRLSHKPNFGDCPRIQAANHSRFGRFHRDIFSKIADCGDCPRIADGRDSTPATDQTCLTMWREAGYAPGRTCSIHASCGTREAGHGGAMSELSDADRRGSRQTRRDASMARSKAQKRSGCASDDARRRGSAMDGAGVPGRGAGANEERRQAPPNALESAKRGSNRGRSGTEPSRLRRVAQDCDPKTYSCMSSGRKDARIAKARRRVPLPRIEQHIDKAGKQHHKAKGE